MPLPILRTASEFIDYYYSKLNTSFASNNFKIVKTGFIGYILNILGNTQYDIKQYYDSLFNEAFPVLAVDETNLEFHSALHGYTRSLATSSTIADGSLQLDLTMLPPIRAGLTSRTITFGSSSAVVGSTLPFGIIASTNIYTIDSIYNVTARLSGSSVVAYDAEIISPGNQKNIGIDVNNPVLPIIAGHQYYTKTVAKTTPYYVPTTFYPIDIQLKSTDQLSGITLTITNSATGVTSTFLTDTNKTKYGPTDNVVFYSILPNNILRLQLGSGTIGSYVPSGSILNVELQLTSGANGNVSISDQANTTIVGLQSANNSTNSTNVVSSQLFANSVYVIDTYGTVSTTSILDITRFLTPTVTTATGGTDILTGEALRSALEVYIQSHDYLISELDYVNYLKGIYSQYYVTFKKTLLSSNTVYAFLPLYDKYNIPYKCSTLTESLSTFQSNLYTQPTTGVTVLFHPTIVSNGVNMISPFYYRYDTLFRSYDGYYLPSTSTFYYSSIQATDVSSQPVLTNLPYIQASFKYMHNSISPFTVISISSYEDLSAFSTLPSSITISFSNLQVTLQTNTPNHISPVVNKTGVSSALVSNITAASTTIPVTDASIFGVSGQLLINNEQLSYTGRDLVNNTLTGVTRGINLTVAATAVATDIVYEISTSTKSIDFILGVIGSSLSASVTSTVTTIPVTDTTYFPPSGTVYIGSEEVTYTAKTLTSLTGCTRGANATVAATHAAGDGIYEKTTTVAAVAQPDLYFGILQSTNQMTVTIADSVTPQTNVFTFSVTQLESLSGNMFVKEYSKLGSSTSLTVSATSTDTTLTVASTVGWATSGYAKIENEYIRYTGTTATTLTGVIRGSYGSTSATHVSGIAVTYVDIMEVDVPFIDASQYTADSAFIDSQINTNIVGLTVPSSRGLSDEVQLRFLESSSISLTLIKQIVYNGSSYTTSVVLPLKVTIDLLINNALLVTSNAVLNDDIYNLNQSITTLLLSTYTGVKIRISDADLVVVCKQLTYVDDANVNFTDSNNVQIPNNEINVKPDLDIMTGLTKTDRLVYVPPLWHWDINNVSITYTVQ